MAAVGLQAGAYSLQADGGTAAAAQPEVCRRECQRQATGRAAALEVYIDTASEIGQAGLFFKEQIKTAIVAENSVLNPRVQDSINSNL